VQLYMAVENDVRCRVRKSTCGVYIYSDIESGAPGSRRSGERLNVREEKGTKQGTLQVYHRCEFDTRTLTRIKWKQSSTPSTIP
jgi:hypothetical protein